MTKERIIHFLDEKNWRISDDLYSEIIEASGDLEAKNLSFHKIGDDFLSEESEAEIERLGGVDEIIEELTVRWVLEDIARDILFS